MVGQAQAVATLRAAAADAASTQPGSAMTHAWLLTGPPGSGRSTAATAFAQSLVCSEQGCGSCLQCRLVVAGSHPDVEIIRPDGISYKTADARALVARASMAPTQSKWHVIVLEDADRLTETANNVLLKAIEEPPPRAVWLLCTPSVEDVLPTIRSRCRHVSLRSPGVYEIADYLVQTAGVDHATAVFAARASQGHVGRARALAADHEVRKRRQAILAVPGSLDGLKACMQAAAGLVDTARADAAAATADLDEKEERELRMAWGEGAEGRGVKGGVRGIKGAIKELLDKQSSRRTRVQRDQLDRALIDLIAFYRDVLVVQFGAHQPTVAGVEPEGSISLVNDEIHTLIEKTAALGTPVDTMYRIDALEHARQALIANVTPLLAMQALTVDLRNPAARRSLA